LIIIAGNDLNIFVREIAAIKKKVRNRIPLSERLVNFHHRLII
jgi:hypothetical protein